MGLRGKSQSFGPLAGALQKSRVSIKLVLGSYLMLNMGRHTTGESGRDGGELHRARSDWRDVHHLDVVDNANLSGRNPSSDARYCHSLNPRSDQ